MLVKVVRRGLMGPNEAVLPTMVPVRACEAASAACVRSVLRGSRFLRQVDCCPK